MASEKPQSRRVTSDKIQLLGVEKCNSPRSGCYVSLNPLSKVTLCTPMQTKDSPGNVSYGGPFFWGGGGQHAFSAPPIIPPQNTYCTPPENVT